MCGQSKCNPQYLAKDATCGLQDFTSARVQHQHSIATLQVAAAPALAGPLLSHQRLGLLPPLPPHLKRPFPACNHNHNLLLRYPHCTRFKATESQCQHGKWPDPVQQLQPEPTAQMMASQH